MEYFIYFISFLLGIIFIKIYEKIKKNSLYLNNCEKCKYYDETIKKCQLFDIYFWEDYRMCDNYERKEE